MPATCTNSQYLPGSTRPPTVTTDVRIVRSTGSCFMKIIISQTAHCISHVHLNDLHGCLHNICYKCYFGIKSYTAINCELTSTAQCTQRQVNMGNEASEIWRQLHKSIWWQKTYKKYSQKQNAHGNKLLSNERHFFIQEKSRQNTHK